MCISAGTLLAMQVGSSLLQGSAANNAAKSQAASLNYEAMAERDAANAQAEKILRATRRERGAARAAIAASGTALDEFALRNEQDIQALGEADVAMSILSGERRGRQTEQQAAQVRQAGRNTMTASLLRGAGQYATGWRGARWRTLPPPWNPIKDFYLSGTTGVGD